MAPGPQLSQPTPAGVSWLALQLSDDVADRTAQKLASLSPLIAGFQLANGRWGTMTPPLHVSKRLCRQSQEVPGEKQKALSRMVLKQRFKRTGSEIPRGKGTQVIFSSGKC